MCYAADFYCQAVNCYHTNEMRRLITMTANPKGEIATLLSTLQKKDSLK